MVKFASDLAPQPHSIPLQADPHACPYLYQIAVYPTSYDCLVNTGHHAISPSSSPHKAPSILHFRVFRTTSPHATKSCSMSFLRPQNTHATAFTPPSITIDLSRRHKPTTANTLHILPHDTARRPAATWPFHNRSRLPQEGVFAITVARAS